MGVFYLESFLLISGISGFPFFAIEHIRKKRKPRKIVISSFFKVLDYLPEFKHFSKHFLSSGYISQSVAQSYEQELTIEA